MLRQVEFMVPVSAFVDTEAGQVTDVVIWDEHFDVREGEVWVFDHTEKVIGEEAARVIDMADDPDEFWPSWRFGL